MENQKIEKPINAQVIEPPRKKGGKCCLVSAGIGFIIFALLLAILIIMGEKLGRERVSRLNAMMEAISEGDIEKAHGFFGEEYRDKISPEDLKAFIETNELDKHTSCQWELGAEDEHGNRIYNGTIAFGDGSEITLYVPVMHEDNEWRVVALLTEEPELPTVDESGDGSFQWGFSFTSATLKNIRLTDEDSPSAPDKSEFPDDIKEIFCLGEVKWAPSNTKIDSKWYYLGKDEKGDELELFSRTLLTTQNSMTLTFTLFRERPLFPQGHYRLKLFVDGKKQVEKNFLVRKPTIEEMRKKGESGDAMSLFRLGTAYVAGIDVEADPEKGLQYIKRAAEAGLPAAQYQYGVELHSGNRLPKNQEEAIKWIRKAAEQNDPDAQYDLGVFYRDGVGVPKDLTEAVVWTRKAAEQGDALAQYNLGLHYKMGVGVTQDFREAVKWLNLAAQQKNAGAMFSLAEHYENGDGVEANIDEAVRLYRDSAALGNEPSKAALQRLGR